MHRVPRPLFSDRLRLLLITASPLLGASPVSAGPQAPPDVLVTSRFGDEVLRYDGATGALLGVFASGGGLDNPVGLTFGACGDLYVASAGTNAVLRFDGSTGGFLDAFVSGAPLDDPRQINFGPDGDLYVANAGTDEVLCFARETGSFLRVAAGGGGLNGPTSFTFGPFGELFVVSVLNDRVKRFDPKTGAYLGNFVTERVRGPHDVGFGPDGRFYVTNASKVVIQAFDPRSGAFLENFVNDPKLSAPLGMAWDGAGRLYVVNQGKNQVRRYDASTGALIDVFVTKPDGGLSSPLFLAFMPPPGPTLEPVVPQIAGAANCVRASGFEPGRRVFLLGGVPGALAPLPRCAGAALELVAPVVMQMAMADESGAIVLGGDVPLALAGVTLHLQALAPRECAATAVRAVTF